MQSIPFLNDDQVREIQSTYGTPVYVYDQATLESQAKQVLAFPNAFGLTARYAMKACPSAAVIRVLSSCGLHIDASSGYEAERALRAGVPPSHIQVTAQEFPHNAKELIDRGVLFNACSIAQIEAYGKIAPNTSLSIRVNPGLGSGHSNRTNVGGPGASFGIWHAYLDEALESAKRHGLTVRGMHTHIGSGSDPEVWERVALMSLEICSTLPDATVLSLGGGYKVGRVKGEVSTDLQKIGLHIVEAFRASAQKTGRELELEVEPGTYLVANAGAFVATAMDVVDTGEEGYHFIKIDGGMTEVLRPSLYGSQHPIEVVMTDDEPRRMVEYVVAGHCCESGDVLTPAPDDPEALAPRLLTETRIGDAVVIGGAGAYCAGMSAKNYNTFPEAAEVMIGRDGSVELVRKRQTIDQILANEMVPSFLE
ncbi:MAG: diaminopimelate decarboxylase [Gemmatimonadetes bacterium]|nr:diaminopimelate decarboxylase [Gemmatimonadota bacterium]|tara:strand:+ start:6402 stop:7670 length:1269 start_codon:yes stop_codon:yes gene_type:complete